MARINRAYKAKTRTDPLVVSRWSEMGTFLIEEGLLKEEEFQDVEGPVYEQDVRDRVVYGPIPLHLAALTKKVVMVHVDIPREKRESTMNRELTLEEIRMWAGSPQTYIVLTEDQVDEIGRMVEGPNPILKVKGLTREEWEK